MISDEIWPVCTFNITLLRDREIFWGVLFSGKFGTQMCCNFPLSADFNPEFNEKLKIFQNFYHGIIK